MTDIILNRENLPTNIEDLSRFVLVGREQLTAVKAEIRAIDKVGLAGEVYEQKLQEAQALAEALLDAEVRIGELMKQVPKASGRPKKIIEPAVENFDEQNVETPLDSGWEFLEQEQPKTKAQVVEDAGFTQKQIEHFQTMADHPELVEEAKAEAREHKSIVTRQSALNKIKAEKKKQQILEAEKTIHKQASDEFKPRLKVGDGIGYVPDEKYDLLLTDPPYSTDVEDVNSFVDDWLYNALDNVKPTGFAYIFIGAYPGEVKAYLNAKTPEHISLCQSLIWTYKNTLGNNPKDRYKQNYQVCLFYRGKEAPDLNCPLTSEQWAVQEINAPDGRQGDRYHAWQKPMEIAERFVRHSTQQGMTVFDPFACTGTFLLAATKLGRKAYGFEIDPENAEIAFSRGCVQDE